MKRTWPTSLPILIGSKPPRYARPPGDVSVNRTSVFRCTPARSSLTLPILLPRQHPHSSLGEVHLPPHAQVHAHVSLLAPVPALVVVVLIAAVARAHPEAGVFPQLLQKVCGRRRARHRGHHPGSLPVHPPHLAHVEVLQVQKRLRWVGRRGDGGGCQVWGVGCQVRGAGCGVWDLGRRLQDKGARV